MFRQSIKIFLACNIVAMTIVTSFPRLASGAELSQLAVFVRCFSQITQTRINLAVPEVSSLYDAVRNNTMSGADACLAVLDLADLTGRDNLANRSVTSVNVLNTMHRLHTSWFEIHSFPKISQGSRNSGTEAIFDPEQPALYFTAALFKSDLEFKSVLTSSDNWEAARTNMTPASSPPVSAAEQAFSPNYFAPVGDLVGVVKNNTRDLTYSVRSAICRTPPCTISHSRHLGAGLMGSQPYLLLTVEEEPGFVADGGIEVPRRWSRSVFNDIMCRSMPVVRPNDALSFVVPSSTVPFRQAGGCVQCHATLDRMASAIRGIHYEFVSGNGSPTPFGGTFVNVTPVTLGPVTGWPAEPEVDYFQRPTNGVLFYRDYAGKLMDVEFSNLADLGVKLSETDDPYNCAAKRYFQYFTGVDVDVGDVTDPGRVQQMTDADVWYRDQVLRMGADLRQHQSVTKLIKSIIESPAYVGKPVGSK